MKNCPSLLDFRALTEFSEESLISMMAPGMMAPFELRVSPEMRLGFSGAKGISLGSTKLAGLEIVCGVGAKGFSA